MKDKFKASFLHFIISSGIIFLFLLVTLLVWYPSPHYELSGLKSILVILLLIDIILGPFLTFVVYKKNKTSLKYDLAVIVGIQIAALFYGVFTVYQGHPVYIVYAIDRFETIAAMDAYPERAKHDEFKTSKLGSPKLAYARMPEDTFVRKQLLFEVLSGKPDIDARPEYYEPFEKFADQVMQQGLTSQQLTSTPDNSQKLDTFLAQHGKNATDYAFLPLVGKEKDVLWAWDKTTKQPVGTLDIAPWQQAQVAAATQKQP